MLLETEALYSESKTLTPEGLVFANGLVKLAAIAPFLAMAAIAASTLFLVPTGIPTQYQQQIAEAAE